MLINEVIIDSMRGEKTFCLVQQDLFTGQHDLTVLNVYGKDREIVGDFAEYVRTLTNGRVLSVLDDGEKIVYYEAPNKVLVIFGKDDENAAISPEKYAASIQALFAAVWRLEMEGVHFETMALPVIFRKAIATIHPYAIEQLIEKASKWLEKSFYTQSIKYYIYLEQDAAAWNEAMNTALGRTAITLEAEGAIANLRRMIISEIELFPSKHRLYVDTLTPLKRSLHSKLVTIEVVAAFSRKLTEAYCEMLTGQASATFDQNLFFLKENKMLSPIFIQQMYLIKNFGNSAVHRSQPFNSPYAFVSEDLKILLLLTYIVLKKLNAFIN